MDEEDLTKGLESSGNNLPFGKCIRIILMVWEMVLEAFSYSSGVIRLNNHPWKIVLRIWFLSAREMLNVFNAFILNWIFFWKCESLEKIFHLTNIWFASSICIGYGHVHNKKWKPIQYGMKEHFAYDYLSAIHFRRSTLCSISWIRNGSKILI